MLRALLSSIVNSIKTRNLPFLPPTPLRERARQTNKDTNSANLEHDLRRRNTRYKNLQLVAQHCFVPRFRRCFPFFTLCDNLSRTKNICCGLKKVVAKSRARVYFEQQILALLLVFHQIHNLSRNKFAGALANQPISSQHFFNLQQMFLLRVKLITQGEKRENIDKNLQRNNVARQVEGFCISYFAAFTSSRNKTNSIFPSYFPCFTEGNVVLSNVFFIYFYHVVLLYLPFEVRSHCLLLIILNHSKDLSVLVGLLLSGSAQLSLFCIFTTTSAIELIYNLFYK